MDNYRSVLEVFKFLPPETILRSTSVTSKHWGNISNSSELWREQLDQTLPYDFSAQTSQKSILQWCLKSRLLPIVQGRTVCLYHAIDRDWKGKKYTKLEMRPVEASIAVLPTGDLVCSGGFYWNGRAFANEAYLLQSFTTVLQMDNMISPRCRHGIVAYHDSAYVFGGRNRDGKLRSSEKLSLETHQWTSIPDMHRERLYFNPCVLSNLIYLCGGLSDTVETFDPMSEMYTDLTMFLPSATESCSAVYDNEILVLSRSYLTYLSPVKSSIASKKHEYYGEIWGKMNPFVAYDKMYISDWRNTRVHIITTTTLKYVEALVPASYWERE